MSEENQTGSVRHLAGYLRQVLEARTTGAEPLDGVPVRTRGAGHLGPTFWADAPWRLEPDQDSIPFTFVVRDANGPNVAMQLDEISVYEAPNDGQPWADKDWQLVQRFTEGLGRILGCYWVYRIPPATPRDRPPGIPLSRFSTAVTGDRLQLKVRFRGSRLRPLQGRQPFECWKPLSVYLAETHLPLRDSPRWYYGDTHYHSSYTNDFKEFGNPVPDTRAAAACIGLDWLVITDHSCDLVDANPYWDEFQADSRWAELGLEVEAHSDECCRLLRGEEVTVLGKPGRGSDTLHMLVFGRACDKFIPGAWAEKGLFADVGLLLAGFASDLFRHLFGPIHRLEAVLTGVEQSGCAIEALRDRSVQAQGAVAFAAHPRSFAQSPGGTWEFYDLVQPIHGIEAWNGDIRRHTAAEESPFDHYQEGKPWDETANKAGIDAWDQVLRHRVGLEDPRFVLLAGSDAHGSFNYSEGWWVDWDGIRVDDNALGKVRTLVYLSHRAASSQREAPSAAEVARALQEGSCVVTNGPVLNYTLGFRTAHVGLGRILKVKGDGTLKVKVQAASTPEFGPVEQVELFYYFRGMGATASIRLEFAVGHTAIVAEELPSGPGYIRLATMTQNGSDTYRCFTNPIWIKSLSTGTRALSVACADW